MDHCMTSLHLADTHLPTGVRLHYAAHGNPAGPPAILLHGYSDAWFSFSRVLPLLPARYHVFALDQRGHGDADRPASGYTMRDLDDFLTQAAPQHAWQEAATIAGGLRR